MSQEVIYQIPNSIKKKALLTRKEYESLYSESLKNPDKFWAKQAEFYLDWTTRWKKVSESDFVTGKVSWFKGAKINASVNCIDRHLKHRSEQPAIIWEGDEPSNSEAITGSLY